MSCSAQVSDMAGNREDFWSRYSTLCLKSKVCPLKSVIRHLKETKLCCPVESVRPEHWLFLLSALYNDNSLTKVHFASCVSPHESPDEFVKIKMKRNKGFPIPYGRSEQNIRNICMSLAGLLHASNYLTVLKLENLALNIVDAEQLSTGLSKGLRSFKALSFSGCLFEEGVVEIICRSLHVSYVSWLDMSSCALSLSDIEAVCKLIKAHSVRRGSEMFQRTLRYRYAVLDEMEGLNRLSLNYNSLENEGVRLLVESMADDLWIKALDLQHCGIENEGAELLLNVAKTNGELEVLDLRKNDIDKNFLQRIEQQLTLNKAGKNVKFTPMPLWKPSDIVRRYNIIKKGKVCKRSSPIKIKLVKKVSRSLNLSMKTATLHRKATKFRDASVQTDDYKFVPELPKSMQDLFNDMRKKIAVEMKLRKFFLQKYSLLKSENDQLRELLIKTENDDIFIDLETYQEIKKTFEKLKVFFDVMKNYGLWEYIAVLGFSDSANVVMTENESQKCVKVEKNETTTPCNDVFETDLEPEVEPCCSCRMVDPNHKFAESSTCHHEAAMNCTAVPNESSNSVTKTDNTFNEKIAVQRIFQEVIENYSGESRSSASHPKPGPAKHTNAATKVPLDNAKPSSSKQSDSKDATGTQMFIKRFSYSNMPKKLKELVSPADFYNIVKKELERCESESKRSSPPAEPDTYWPCYKDSMDLESLPPPAFLPPARRLFAAELDKINSSNSLSNEQFSPKVKQSKPQSVPQPNLKPQHSIRKGSKGRLSSEEDSDDISIAELIARKKTAMMLASQQNVTPPKYIPLKKEPAKLPSSSLSSCKVQKNSKKCQNKMELKQPHYPPVTGKVVPTSKQKPPSSNSSQTVKKIQARSNASSYEINSSDSVVTASDKLSDSSVSSSSSDVSLTKNSSNDNDSEPQKSYIESVSDASTFKDVESISDTEVASHASSRSGSEREKNESKNKNVSVTNAPSASSSVSQSVPKSKKGGKSNVNVSSASSSTLKVVPESKKSDKPVHANSSTQGKTKNANKQSGKNRPKGSSKSSSVPSLSDITTVSSQSLNTDSIMQQISASEDDAKNMK